MNRLSSILRLLCVALCVTLSIPSACLATTYYVATTGNDNNSGTQAQPFATIGRAVYYANTGDTVLVADGIYSGAGNRNIDFGGRDRTVQSASGNPANCIIDCQKSGCAFILQSGETANSYIAGFTIKNGTGYNGGGIYMYTIDPIVNNCTFTGNSATNDGGGMYEGTATKCIFIGNSAGSYGGGMAAGFESSLATNCTFTNNLAHSGGGGMDNGWATNCTFTGNSAGSGGGINDGAATNCTFTSNSATYDGGGGMYNGPATNCTFIGNSANGTYPDGGGMNYGTATNCTFTNNSATYGGGTSDGTATNCTFIGNSAVYGGGMVGDGLSPNTATSCTFIGNSASSGGGMNYGTATNCIFTNNSAGSGGGTYAASLYFCALANNTATRRGGGVYLSKSTITNCIVWGNIAATSGSNISDDGTSGADAVKYSDIQGGYTGTSNINADPLFVDSASGNVHLSAGSPGIDAGTTKVPTSLLPYGSFTFPATDHDGGKRIVGAKPDMGAYEYGNAGIFGRLTFSGIAANAPAQNVTFQFRPANGGAAINQTYLTTPDGAFYLYGLPNGKYNLWAKSSTYLAAVVPVTISGGDASVTATLKPGDCNNDNSCDATDFGILIGAYGGVGYDPATGYDPRADFNGDGKVDMIDFGLLVGSYGEIGAL